MFHLHRYAAVVVLSLLALPAWGQVTVGNTGTATEGFATSISWSHTVAAGSNKVLMVGVALDAGSTVDSITFGATSLNPARTDQNTGSVRSELWYATGVSGTDTVTVTPVVKSRMVANSVDFSNGGTPDNCTGRQEDAATSSSLTITAAGDNDYLIDMLAEGANQNATQGADQTEYADIAHHASLSGAGSTQDGVVSGDVMSWSFGSADIAQTACRIPEFVAGGRRRPSLVMPD